MTVFGCDQCLLIHKLHFLLKIKFSFDELTYPKAEKVQTEPTIPHADGVPTDQKDLSA